MKRYVLGLQYCGLLYHGWQQQEKSPDLDTIEGKIRLALCRVANHEVTVCCAGRTDAGVHALHQVIHFDSSALREARAWVCGANSHLPASIRVLWAVEVTDAFSARYSARSRTYHYVISNHAVSMPLLAGQAANIRFPLDLVAMRDAVQYLLGEHDFSAFRTRDCQAKSTRRHLKALTIFQRGDLICIRISANAFLHRMVRNIVGMLITIGRGQRPSAWAQTVLEGRCRKRSNYCAPAEGLYLTGVEYPDVFDIPKIGIAHPLIEWILAGDQG